MSAVSAACATSVLAAGLKGGGSKFDARLPLTTPPQSSLKHSPQNGHRLVQFGRGGRHARSFVG